MSSRLDRLKFGNRKLTQTHLILRGANHPSSKPVLVFKNGSMIKEFPGVMECVRCSEKYLGILLEKWRILSAIKTKREYNGFMFEYKQIYLF